jgi:hypothetical protein
MILIPFVVVLVPLMIGQGYGLKQRDKVMDLQHAPIGAITGASFGLPALLLAFTFQITASRFNVCKKLFLISNLKKTIA